MTIDDIQNKLNLDEYLPSKAYRRNFKYYELVSYVNNMTGCLLSDNAKPLKVLIERVKYFMELNPSSEETKKYYELVDQYISKIEGQLNEKTL